MIHARASVDTDRASHYSTFWLSSKVHRKGDRPNVMTANGPTLTVSLPSDREIVLTREFDAPRALLFETLTRAEHLQHWFGPRGYTISQLEQDPRPGGAWRIVHRDPDGNDFA